MEILDAFGHFGYILIAVGMLLLGKYRIVGWLFRAIGELVWVVIGWQLGMSSIWLWGLLFFCIDLKGWREWRKTRNLTT